MRYSLREAFVIIAILAYCVWRLTLAFAQRSDALALLEGASILAALLGVGLSIAFRMRRPQQATLTISLAALAGLISSFFVIQSEWMGDPGDLNASHAWPDRYQIPLAVIRCAALGGMIGFLAWVVTRIAAGAAYQGFRTPDQEDSRDTGHAIRNPERSFHRRAPVFFSNEFLLSCITVTLLTLAWLPYWSFHQQERSCVRLLSAIEMGSLYKVRRQLPTATRYDGGAIAISRIAYLARSGNHEQIRMTALQALKLLGESARRAPVLRPLRNDMRLNDANAEVRAAAAEWLESGQVP